ncbi:MAG: sigma-70 family RNA polymerase sigma factor [Anaerolineae bacterium]|nr:sigma-70 family RNA polymerase sigma factor [Phycisphaerae bacterium]
MLNLAEPLRRFVRKRVNDSHEADDIVQDVLLRAIANADSTPPDERLAAWMFRSARNLIIDRFRSRAVRDAASIETIDPIQDDDDDVDEQAGVVAELAACLRCMVDRLDAPYRKALKLADLNGRTQQQVANKMDISLSGAKSRVQRARQQLQAMLSACCNVERDARGNVTDFQPSDRSRQSCADRGCDPDAKPCD